MDMTKVKDEQIKLVIDKEWKLLKRIGGGSFGEIYSCINMRTGNEAAVKLVRNKRKFVDQLHFEHKALKLLSDGEGIVKEFLCENNCINNQFVALIMEQLGPSLEDLRLYCNGKFSLKTTIMLADQMIRRLEFLHSRHLIHRDIKPENFLMGYGRKFNIVYIIDFGLSKQYINPISKLHLPFKEFRNLTGTANYCSINAHAGFEQSRRDDLESLGYILIYFLDGCLPWQDTKSENKLHRFQLIHQAKLNMKLEDLCRNVPTEFLTYMSYCKCLNFQEYPKYHFLRNMLWSLLDKYNLKYDFQFDWIMKSS